ncbi:MAG: Hydroxysqualene synthase [Pseudomonadota bacterium]
MASFLLPRAQRAAVIAIYQFARYADDVADEGEALPDARLQALHELEQNLHAVYAGTASSLLTPHTQRLPKHLFIDLLSAFKQDVHKHHYADWPELLDYCARSANPIGRLMLALFNVNAPEALQQSDAICTALQLSNFWQDVAIDQHKGRVYLPQSLLTDLHDVNTDHYSPEIACVLAQASDNTWQMFVQGAPLLRQLRGRFKWEIAYTIAGGMLILKKLKTVHYNVWKHRPVLSKADLPALTCMAVKLIFKHR